MFCSGCGTQTVEGALFCRQCGKPAESSAHVALQSHAQDVLPEGVKGWSWGAFLLNWIWAIGNRTWIGLLAIVPYIGFLVALWLGFKGREMAWKNGKWDSVEHFNRVQRKWSAWAVGILVGSALIGVLAAIAIPAYQNYIQRAHEQMQESQGDSATGQQVALIQREQGPANVEQAISESGAIDSNAAGLPEALDTVAGKLARTEAAGNQRVMSLNGTALFSGDDGPWQFPVRSFKLSGGREAILMASSGGRGNSCETLFFFLVADANGMTTTPEFGTCSPQGSFTQHGDTITLELPKMGAMSRVVFSNGVVLQDGQVVNLEDSNNPAK